MISRRQVLFLALMRRALSAQRPPDWLGLTTLRDGQVVQRDHEQGITLRVAGTAPPDVEGVVEVSIGGGDTTQSSGRLSKGFWSAELSLPTGGPYRIRFDARSSAGALLARHTVDDVLVGDLWVLAGQSNMQGRGDLIDVEPSSPLVHSFDMLENWVVAKDPLHVFSTARDPVYRTSAAQLEVEEPRVGAGLGLPFAKQILAATGVPVGLIPCALGGSSIVRWDPAQREDPSSLYGAMLRRIGKAGGTAISGVLWYQGETDSRDPKVAWEYGRRLRNLIAAVREYTGRPHLAFYMVQVGRMLDWVYYGVAGRRPPVTLNAQFSAVREAQRRVAEELDHTGLVASIDLDVRDAIHMSTPSLKRLGARLAKVVLTNEYGSKGLPMGPRLQSVEGDAASERILVRFSDVNGGLSAQGRLAGFMLRAVDGTEVPAIFRQTVDPASASTVVLRYQGKLPASVRLFYGWGVNPYCNLVDAGDMAVPCFGPVEIEGLSVSASQPPDAVCEE